MGLATDIADKFGSPLPLGKTAENIYADVLKQQPAFARKDFSSVYRYLRFAAQEGKKVHASEVTSP
jgi:3-hydroxyisobutyrate dehydrogenase